MAVQRLKMLPVFTTIDKSCASHGQGADYDEIVQWDANRLRVQIHADTSYKTQSHAKVSVWRDGWQEVARILPANVHSDNVTRYLPKTDNGFGPGQCVGVPEGFAHGCGHLLRIATKVLS